MKYPFSKKIIFIFGTIGSCLLFEKHFIKNYFKSNENNCNPDYKKIFFLRLLFGRSRSKILGKIFNLNLPISLRKNFYGFLIDKFLFNDSYSNYSKKEKIEKFEQKLLFPLESYKSIGEFFTRSMKISEINIQEIDNVNSISSPCEGKILEFGKVDSDKCIQVKSSKFRVSELLKENFESLIATRNLYYATIYLSPKNYHRFHTPSKIKIEKVKHISGECFPVFKGIASRLNNLFCLNERVIIKSLWEYGEMYIVAVAAHGVSDIRLSCVPELRTNIPNKGPIYSTKKHIEITVHENFEKAKNNGVYDKGDELGLFNLGSTIILLFQVPERFEFNVTRNEEIQLGSVIGRIQK